MVRRLPIFLLLSTLLLTACATYRGWVGWAATDLSWMEVEMEREKVEDKLGKPIQPYITEQGFLAVYEYDRGWIPPSEEDPRKKALAPIFLVADVVTLGMMGFLSEPQGAACQRGRLRVLYDKASKILAVKECWEPPDKIDCDSHRRRPSTLPKTFTDEPIVALDCRVPRKLYIEPDKANEPSPLSKIQVNEPAPLSNIQILAQLCQAADEGESEAQWRLGSIFYYGWYGVVKDHIRSHMWYSKASTSSGVWARLATRQLVTGFNELTSTQVAQAEQMIANWELGQCERDLVSKDSDD